MTWGMCFAVVVESVASNPEIQRRSFGGVGGRAAAHPQNLEVRVPEVWKSAPPPLYTIYCIAEGTRM